MVNARVNVMTVGIHGIRQTIGSALTGKEVRERNVLRMKYSEMSEEQKEKYRQYHRNYYQTHKQQHRARCEKWAKEHPDKVKESRNKYFKKYWERNKDRIMQRRQELHPRKFVAVVRCKDCRFRYTDSCITKKPLMDDFFCWQGTPKEGR